MNNQLVIREPARVDELLEHANFWLEAEYAPYDVRYFPARDDNDDIFTVPYNFSTKSVFRYLTQSRYASSSLSSPRQVPESDWKELKHLLAYQNLLNWGYREK